VCDAAGDLIVTGSTGDGITRPDMLTIKFSGADGSVLWRKSYNGPANSLDAAYAAAVDSSGNVGVTGYSQGDFYTAKYAGEIARCSGRDAATLPGPGSRGTCVDE